VILHERIMMLTRKGMHVDCFDPQLSLEARWAYSQALATKLNNGSLAAASNWNELEASIDNYFTAQDKIQIKEAELYNYKLNSSWRQNTILQLIGWFPIFLLGLVHIALPYLFVKRFVEKSFKRRVFWSGAKMGMLLVLIPVWNLILLGIATNFIELNCLVWLGYFLALNFVAHGFHRFVAAYRRLKKSKSFNAQKLNELVIHRTALLKLLQENGL
jgi:hypothetical protein